MEINRRERGSVFFRSHGRSLAKHASRAEMKISGSASGTFHPPTHQENGVSSFHSIHECRRRCVCFKWCRAIDSLLLVLSRQWRKPLCAAHWQRHMHIFQVYLSTCWCRTKKSAAAQVYFFNCMLQRVHLLAPGSGSRAVADGWFSQSPEQPDWLLLRQALRQFVWQMEGDMPLTAGWDFLMNSVTFWIPRWFNKSHVQFHSRK